ncbi:hypothetical protein DRO61_10640 [Candidatus Bathyarchaeota archaeon]|nr:MAG: hypothetical protein DRO61_10640 [Candidatus Bathyarchaeota archaeon]
MHKSTLGSTAGDHIDTIDKAPVKSNEDLLDAIPRDIGEYTRDAQADTFADNTRQSADLCGGELLSNTRSSSSRV